MYDKLYEKHPQRIRLSFILATRACDHLDESKSLIHFHFSYFRLNTFVQNYTHVESRKIFVSSPILISNCNLRNGCARVSIHQNGGGDTCIKRKVSGTEQSTIYEWLMDRGGYRNETNSRLVSIVRSLHSAEIVPRGLPPTKPAG